VIKFSRFILFKILIEANRKAEKLKNQNEAKRIQSQLKFKTKSMSLPDDVQSDNKRELLYHTDLIAIKPINNDQTSSSTKTKYHLILFDDFLLVSLREVNKQEEQTTNYLVLEMYEKERISAEIIDYEAPESTDKLSCFLIFSIKSLNAEEKKYCFICNK